MNTRFIAFVGGLVWYILSVPLILLSTLMLIIVVVLTPLQLIFYVIKKEPIKPKLDELLENTGKLPDNFIRGFQNANQNFKYAFTGKL